ncbi:MAG TPA: aspartate/glutamate racemase family protein [Gaiellaceae bacterium]
MAATVGFVHTVLTLAPTFNALADELVPDAERFHIADESLLGVTRRTGSLTPATRRRVLGYVESAAEAGADLVVVTCSSIGPAVDASHEFVDVPVLRIDEPMADEAVRIGSRVGVLATLATTLEPTAELVERRGDGVEVVSHLCDGAFDALQAGDLERHDELIREGLRETAKDVDVIVLAQASMARVVDALPEEEKTVPVLSSPRLGMQRVAELLAQRG